MRAISGNRLVPRQSLTRNDASHGPHALAAVARVNQLYGLYSASPLICSSQLHLALMPGRIK